MIRLDGVSLKTENFETFLRNFHMDDVTVIFANTKKKADYWMANEFFQTLPFPGYDSFRAWSEHDTKTIIIFDDEAETGDSLFWVMVHELAHLEVRTSKWLLTFTALDYETKKIIESLGKPRAGYLKLIRENDDMHENDPEEAFCNRIATAICGGDFYDRKWWRSRKKQPNND